MSSGGRIPDYELEDLRTVTAPQELRAMFHDLRSTVLELLIERAATVGELAAALGRPKSTVAYHLNVLVEAGLVKIVRTRRVRAIDERFYGRTARIFSVGTITRDELPLLTNCLTTAANESAPAHADDNLRAITRHARIPDSAAETFWRRVLDLVDEFTQLPREGQTVYGLVAGLYPTDHPTLPPPNPEGDRP
ncbi:MAG TPA: helix-turn-helix domain-containing protein [Jatrophihabitans sp.]